jgi:peptidyl-dipeptidase Dcp
MKLNLISFTQLCLVFAILISSSTGISGQTTTPQDSKSMNSILLKPWIGPYGGVPPWRQVNRDEFLGAFDAAIKISDQEIEAIANNPYPPTF